jgi:hypothetical protein
MLINFLKKRSILQKIRHLKIKIISKNGEKSYSILVVPCWDFEGKYNATVP